MKLINSIQLILLSLKFKITGKYKITIQNGPEEDKDVVTVNVTEKFFPNKRIEMT